MLGAYCWVPVDPRKREDMFFLRALFWTEDGMKLGMELVGAAFNVEELVKLLLIELLLTVGCWLWSPEVVW